jgi:hypothetical protein
VEKMSNERWANILRVVRGTTLSVYAFLLTKDGLGVRDIQRELKLSSPSVALHHLRKLVNVGLITQDNHGIYSIKEHIRIGVLSVFVRIGTKLVPRLLFLVSFTILSLVLYILLLASWPLETKDIAFLSVDLVVVLLLAHESRSMRLLKPF